MVGLVVGAGLVWFVVADQRRREVDIEDDERAREALWLSASLADEGLDVSPGTAARMLALHRAYLEAPPPDDERPPLDEAWPPDAGPSRDGPPSEFPADDGRLVDRGRTEVGE